MAVVIRQSVTGFAAAGVTTVTADFTADLGACLAGSAIVFVVGGDKNSGTFTAPADTPTAPVNLRATDVSLIMAWGTADGGETVVSGTIATNAGGSQVWMLELIDDAGATGAWSVAASATNNTDGSAVTAWSTGTTGAASAAGLAIAAVAADSVNTAGTPTWSNSYVSGRVTNSGGGQAGLWGSTKAIAASATTETTLTRTGGTADQHSGAVLVFTRATGSNTAAVAGAARPATGALTATQRTTGALAGAARPATGSLAATQTTTGALAAQARPATGDAAAALVDPGLVIGSTPVPVGNLTGTQTMPGAVAALAPRPTGDLVGQIVFPVIEGAFAAVAPAAVGGLTQIPAPPDDLPLRAGSPTLAATRRAGVPTIAAGLYGGVPEVR